MGKAECLSLVFEFSSKKVNTRCDRHGMCPRSLR
uniref:Uncharacterized protein n=1 Tax=Anguilla anguilla TaxID=7936 RepID=A0A0E9TNP5_ANGAN